MRGKFTRQPFRTLYDNRIGYLTDTRLSPLDKVALAFVDRDSIVNIVPVPTSQFLRFRAGTLDEILIEEKGRSFPRNEVVQVSELPVREKTIVKFGLYTTDDSYKFKIPADVPVEEIFVLPFEFYTETRAKIPAIAKILAGATDKNCALREEEIIIRNQTVFRTSEDKRKKIIPDTAFLKPGVYLVGITRPKKSPPQIPGYYGGNPIPEEWTVEITKKCSIDTFRNTVNERVRTDSWTAPVGLAPSIDYIVKAEA